MTANRHSIFYGVDLWTVLLYVLIVLAGWVSITSASYDPDIHITGFHFYLKFIRMINRNSIYFLPDQSGINIKRTYYL